MLNIVIRKCSKCGHQGDQDKEFTYLRNGVWSCDECNSKWTDVSEVVDPDKIGGEKL